MFAKVDEWKRSRMTKREFCHTNAIAKSTFEYWIHKKRKSNKKVAPFIELIADPLTAALDSKPVVSNKQSGNRHVEFTFPNGLCIKVFM